MLEKFKKLAQKAKYNKDEFYREVFTPTSLALLSNKNSWNKIFKFKIKFLLKTLIQLGPTSSSQELFSSKMFNSTNLLNSTPEREAIFSNGHPNERKTNGENMNKIFIQDKKLNKGPELKKNEEEAFTEDNSYQDSNEAKSKMTKEEVESLIDNKRSELDIKIYNLVNRNQIEERKIEDTINNETDEEEKTRLVKMLEEEIKKNENNIALLKE